MPLAILTGAVLPSLSRHSLLVSSIGAADGSRRGEVQDNALHICESQSQSNYWPTDRIQCHLFAEWFQLAALADYNVLWMPLGPVARAQFDAAAAWEERGRDPKLVRGWLIQNLKGIHPATISKVVRALEAEFPYSGRV